MQSCWRPDPEERATFRSIADDLNDLLNGVTSRQQDSKRNKYYNVTEVEAFSTSKKQKAKKKGTKK